MRGLVTGTVGRRLVAVFAVILVLFTTALAVALAAIGAQSSALDQVSALQRATRQVQQLHFYEESVSGWEAFVLLEAYQRGNTAAVADDAYNLTGLRSTHTDLDAALAAVDTSVPNPAEAEAFTTLQATWETYWQTDATMLEMVRTGGAEGLTRATVFLNDGDLADLYEQVVTAVDRVADPLEARGTVARATADRAARHAQLLAVVAAVRAATAGALLLWLATRSITGPLRRAVTVLEGMADGHLDGQLNLDRRDELGRLSRALDRATSTLSQVLRRVGVNAQRVSAASKTLSATADQMAHALRVRLS